MTRPVLVIDKSALRAFGREQLVDVSKRFSFLFPMDLLYEISTDQCAKFSLRVWGNRLRNIRGYWKHPLKDLIRFELETGQTAKVAPNIVEQKYDSQFWKRSKPIEAVLDNSLAQVMNMPFKPEDRKTVKRMQNAPREQWFLWLREWLRSQPVAALAEREFRTYAKQEAIDVHRCFSPDPGWYCWGFKLVGIASLYYKAKWLGVGTAGIQKAASAMLDMLYLPHLVEADGLLSNDGDLLDLASACWPEKADLICPVSDLIQ